MAADKWSVVLFGGLSRFTFFTLEKLLKRRFRINAVALHAFGPPPYPANQHPQLTAAPDSPLIAKICRDQDIALIYSVNDDERLLKFLDSYRAQYYVVSCYPRLLSNAVIRFAERQCVNIHPSLLPRYRGANPIFWQLKNEEPNTGVTLHLLTDALDAGDILDARTVSYGEGARLSEIENKLIDSAIGSLESLARNWPGSKTGHQQIAEDSTRHPPPSDDDFVVDAAHFTARGAFNLLRAYSESNVNLRVTSHGVCYSVRDAVSFTTGSKSVGSKGDSSRIAVDFLDGTVELEVFSRQLDEVPIH